MLTNTRLWNTPSAGKAMSTSSGNVIFRIGRNSLTEAQRLAWIEQGKHAESCSRLGKRWSLTGQTYFIRINSARAAFGLRMLTDPPPLDQHLPNPVNALIITNRGGRIALKMKVAGPLKPDIMVFGAPPCGTVR